MREGGSLHHPLIDTVVDNSWRIELILSSPITNWCQEMDRWKWSSGSGSYQRDTHKEVESWIEHDIAAMKSYCIPLTKLTKLWDGDQWLLLCGIKLPNLDNCLWARRIVLAIGRGETAQGPMSSSHDCMSMRGSDATKKQLSNHFLSHGACAWT